MGCSRGPPAVASPFVTKLVEVELLATECDINGRGVIHQSIRCIEICFCEAVAVCALDVEKLESELPEANMEHHMAFTRTQQHSPTTSLNDHKSQLPPWFEHAAGAGAGPPRNRSGS